MTSQEIFDTVVEALRAQGEKSGFFNETTERFECLYRSPKGLKCAFGHLISDDEYNSKMEHSCASSVIVDYGLERFYGHGDLCNELQAIHDRYPISHWEEKLDSVAIRYSLDYSADHLKRLPDYRTTNL